MDYNIEDALKAARKAVQYDINKQYQQAIEYYVLAMMCLHKLSLDSIYEEKMLEYQGRIAVLRQYLVNEPQKPVMGMEEEIVLQKCKSLFNQGLDADEAGQKTVAVKLYTDAAELGLRMKFVTPELKNKVTNLIRLALDRAELLKGIKRNETTSKNIEISLAKLPAVPEDNPSEETINSSTIESRKQWKPPLHRGSSAHLKVTGGSLVYTEEEKKVLLYSSHINDHEFVPFMDVDLSEKFKYNKKFIDKDGFLVLAPNQKVDFSRWARPDDIFVQPKMVKGRHVDYYSIKQTVVSDCSFVASLAVSAQYEKKFGRRLITSIIYPQNEKSKEPVYNPSGKYMVKLRINGVPRKIIIDDLLPLNKDNHLLCSYSSHEGELWISLLEKAYMKVMGGYDFPGSNSNIDLHALTGWIPERWSIKQNDEISNKEQLFNILLTRLHKGDVLGTVATGELSEADVERTGLVSNHAYAILDVRNIDDKRLVQLKNPWSHVRWKGNYSELDTIHWTSELKEKLNYEPEKASQNDNGIFWIDFISICQFFEVVYLNWNPGLFNYTYCIHQAWKAGVGPVKDAYNIGDNPQFLLEAEGNTSGAIWILLTRHITDIADFRENQEYITVLVYHNNGKRVYYPYDPPPYIEGVKINSPHYLCKIRLDKEIKDKQYTLVISQYEKTTTIYYTFRAYGTCPFKLRPMPQFYKYEQEVTGEWKGVTAGGCSNYSTYSNNPCYQLHLESSHDKNYLLIILKGPKQYQIGFEFTSPVASEENVHDFKRKHSGSFRSGFCYIELEDVAKGRYYIIPSTYQPEQEGPFFLICKTSCKLDLRISESK